MSNSPVPGGLEFPQILRANPIPDQLAVEGLPVDLVGLRVFPLKPFGMLVTGTGEGEGLEDRVIGSSGGRVIGEPAMGNPTREVGATPRPKLEARYAYYRRCQKFCGNGVQCKAPAMKEESICHQHAQQADNNRRREQQRREMLNRMWRRLRLGSDPLDMVA